MRRALLLPLLIAAALAAAASAPVQPQSETIDAQLQRARVEASAADAQVQRLQQAASKALDTAGKLRVQQLAAAEAIGAAEARITAADAEMRLVAVRQVLLQSRLRREQQPLSSLLAGLAMMAQRPPLLALADKGSTDELVRVRVLLDATLPLIRARTAGLSRQLSEGARLEEAAGSARAKLQSSRDELSKRRQEFATLERQALLAAAANSGEALSAGDTALAATETLDTLSAAAQHSRASAAAASALAASGEPPPGPAALDPVRSSISYILPAEAPVTTGLGAVSESGVRSRGISLATRRGASVRAPADGVLKFAGPFRDYDGIVIIDHGRGWTSLLVNVGTQLRVGDRVKLGGPLGRALGPLEVELSRSGRHLSPAIIAGSSASLSKDAG